MRKKKISKDGEKSLRHCRILKQCMREPICFFLMFTNLHLANSIHTLKDATFGSESCPPQREQTFHFQRIVENVAPQNVCFQIHGE